MIKTGEVRTGEVYSWLVLRINDFTEDLPQYCSAAKRSTTTRHKK